jgi:hypothetical protein
VRLRGGESNSIGTHWSCSQCNQKWPNFEFFAGLIPHITFFQIHKESDGFNPDLGIFVHGPKSDTGQMFCNLNSV